MALLCSACLETSGLLRRIAKTQAEDACVCLAHMTPSCTATLIYIAAWFKINIINFLHYMF
jgi:hypothetical protein